jgi:cell division transport system ATP-binding protein
MKFILNTTVILLLLPNKQMLIMSQAVLSLKNVTIYQDKRYFI